MDGDEVKVEVEDDEIRAHLSDEDIARLGRQARATEAEEARYGERR